MDVTFREDILNSSTVSSKVFNNNSQGEVIQEKAKDGHNDAHYEVQDSLAGSSFDPSKYNIVNQLNGSYTNGHNISVDHL